MTFQSAQNTVHGSATKKQMLSRPVNLVRWAVAMARHTVSTAEKGTEDLGTLGSRNRMEWCKVPLSMIQAMGTVHDYLINSQLSLRRANQTIQKISKKG